ncbi:phosphatase 2C-like domain-containing protein [Hyaloraphidium curvatum]|nr:phosphatase 2C-like domain-containing protein [Hyaloraphidium curvatum]
MPPPTPPLLDGLAISRTPSPFRRNSLWTVPEPPDAAGGVSPDGPPPEVLEVPAAALSLVLSSESDDAVVLPAEDDSPPDDAPRGMLPALPRDALPAPTAPLPLPDPDHSSHAQIITPNTSPGRDAPRQRKLTRPIVSFAAAAQQGFRLVGQRRARLHDQMEDVEWAAEPFAHPVSGLPVWLLVLADGHGGVGAPTFFVGRLRELVVPVLTGRDWDFDEVADRNEFSNLVRGLYASMDDEYVNLKKLEYLAWREAGATDANGAKKPVDDGCTLILNCVYNGYLVNVNVGDSRTVLGRQARPLLEHAGLPAASPAASLSSSSSSTASNISAPRQRWSLYFSSVDHSPSHPEKALWVSRHGGIFINDNGTRRNVKIDEKRKKPYQDLVGARILRPLDDNVKAIGVSHLRTLNLASTMGDLLYKIPPAVLSPLPDVSFVRLTPQYDYLLVAATDGLWDHLKTSAAPEGQARSVVAWAGDEWDRIGEAEFAADGQGVPAAARHAPGSGGPDGEEEEEDGPTAVRTRCGGTNGRLLEKLARRLADRERNSELFFGGWIRVDDAMVVVAHVRGLE